MKVTTPSAGIVTPALGNVTSSVGNMTPSVGNVISPVGNVTSRSVGNAMSTKNVTFSSFNNETTGTSGTRYVFFNHKMFLNPARFSYWHLTNENQSTMQPTS